MKKPSLYGRKPVLEALRAGRPLSEVWTTAFVEEIETLAAQVGVRVTRVTKDRIHSLLPDANHQGVAAFEETPSIRKWDVEEILEMAKQKGEKPLLVLLDGITDPHNLGAIIRCAECAGFHGVILPKHGSAEVNSTVVKTSAGATHFIPVATVTNLVHAIEFLKEAGCWIYGADESAEKDFQGTDSTDAIALVIGSEGKGMRKGVVEHCDFLIRIPVFGRISSLNASVAAGIMMYEIAMRRRKGS